MAEYVIKVGEKLLKKLNQEWGSPDFSSRLVKLCSMLNDLSKNGEGDDASRYIDELKALVDGIEVEVFEKDFTRKRLEEIERKIDQGMSDLVWFCQLKAARDRKTVAKDTVELRETAPVPTLLVFDSTKLTVDNTVVGTKKTSLVMFGSYDSNPVAVKLKMPSDSFSSHSGENFLREALILQILNNRSIDGIIQFFGVDNANAPTMLLLEQGKSTLAEFLVANPRFPLQGRLEFLWKCCSVFAVLVEQKVLHRDIKPENVLIMFDNSIKIMNFGFVRSEESGLSTSVTLRGTHSYVAPELLMNTTGHYQYSEATDMYSFAIMINRVLTGVNPFAQYSHNQLIGLMYKSKGMHRPDLITESAYPGNEGVCQGLAAIITLCWNVYPQLRLTFKTLEEQLRLLAPKAQEIEDVLMEEG